MRIKIRNVGHKIHQRICLVTKSKTDMKIDFSCLLKARVAYFWKTELDRKRLGVVKKALKYKSPRQTLVLGLLLLYLSFSQTLPLSSNPIFPHCGLAKSSFLLSSMLKAMIKGQASPAVCTVHILQGAEGYEEDGHV